MNKESRYNLDKYFLKWSYPTSYPLFICHALKQKGVGIDEARSLLYTMMECMRKRKSFYKSNFLEMAPCSFGLAQGFVVIDRTKSCSPLILYPHQYNPNNHGDRCAAFYHSLRAIAQNLENIMPVLLDPSHFEWDNLIKEKLSGIVGTKRPLKLMSLR